MRLLIMLHTLMHVKVTVIKRYSGVGSRLKVCVGGGGARLINKEKKVFGVLVLYMYMYNFAKKWEA